MGLLEDYPISYRKIFTKARIGGEPRSTAFASTLFPRPGRHAVSEVTTLHGHHAAWLEVRPENLQDSAAAEASQAIRDLDSENGRPDSSKLGAVVIVAQYKPQTKQGCVEGPKSERPNHSLELLAKRIDN
jgi:hypothetical protein